MVVIYNCITACVTIQSVTYSSQCQLPNTNTQYYNFIIYSQHNNNGDRILTQRNKIGSTLIQR